MNNLINLSKTISNVTLMTIKNITRSITTTINLKPTKTTGHGRNCHKSNRAKKGLYHGKDIMSGYSISHSHAKTKRKWYPNVINKRVWSDALDDWVRFKMTTKALKEIDNIGGIDKYLLALDEKSVTDSNYVTKMRGLIGAALYNKGLFDEKLIRKLNYHKEPPIKNNTTNNIDSKEEAHLV
jgi:ribosomal protein L28